MDPSGVGRGLNRRGRTGTIPVIRPEGFAMIRRLHHAAYRCRDSEETRRFYEDFLGLPLVHAFPIETTKSGRSANVLHSFYEMDDRSCIAFFEAPHEPFEFKDQHDFDLHIALEVDDETLERMLARGRREGRETRGISDHGFCRSIYFRDPNGYVVELAAPVAGSETPTRAEAGRALSRWQAGKGSAAR